MIDLAFRGSRSYWIWMSFLAIIGTIGILCYIQQLHDGLAITGMSRDVSWGMYIAQLAFFVGIAASGVMVVLPCYLHEQKEFSRITILGEFLAVVACGLAICFVMVDLGQPERFINLWLHPSPNSPLFYDTIVLTGYLVINLVVGWSMLDAENKGEKPRRFVKPLIYISIPLAASIHTVTAFIFAGLASKPFWLSAVMAPRFLSTAFAAGPALLILICLVLRRVSGFDAGTIAIRKLTTIVIYATTISLFFLLCEYFTVFYCGMPEHASSFKYVLLGEGGNGLQPWMWTSLIMTVFAIGLLLYTRITHLRMDLVAIGCLLVFVSLWLDKGLIMVAAGFIPNALHEFTEYWPSGYETVISVGLWALGLMVLSFLLKIAVSVKLDSLSDKRSR